MALFNPHIPMANLIIEALVIGVVFSVGFFFVGHIADTILNFFKNDE